MKRTATILILAFSLMTTGCGAERDISEVQTEAEEAVRQIEYDEMIEQIAEETGNSAEYISLEIVNDRLELLEEIDPTGVYNRRDIEKRIREKSYVVVHIGNMPLENEKYRAEGISVYGEGELIGQDHCTLERAIYVTFSAKNSADEQDKAKYYLNGHVFVNLEQEDVIYYSVDGDVYKADEEIGLKSQKDRGGASIAETFYYLREGTHADRYSHYDYIYYDGKWFG